MAGSANVGDVVLGVRIDDAALSAGLENTRRRIEGAAPVTLQPPTYGKNVTFGRGGLPPPTIDLPEFNPAELERIRVTQGLTAVSTRRIGEAAQQARPGVAALGSSLNQAAQGAAEVVASQAGIPPALAQLVTGAGGAVALGAGLAVAAGFSVSTANEMQRLQQQLVLVTGSSENANAVFEQMKAFGQITPFDTPELVATVRQLGAYGLSTQQAVDATKQLADIATVTSVPISRLAYNYGQVISKGSANAIDLKQFAEAGVPIYTALADVTGKTAAELRGLGQAIPADQVVAAFAKMTSEGGTFYEGAIKGGTALDAQWANLSDSIKAAALPLGQLLTPAIVATLVDWSTTLGTVADGFTQIKTAADALFKNPLIGKAGAFITAALQSVTNPIAAAQKLAALVSGKELPGQAGKSKTLPQINPTQADLKKEQDQKDSAKAAAEEAARKEEERRAKEEIAAAQAARQAEARRVEALQTKKSLEELVALQAQISPGGQGLAIAGINPQTVGQVQQIASTIDITGNRFAQTLVKGAIDSGNALLKAQDQVTEAQRASFDLLTDDRQQRLKQQAADNILQNSTAAGFDENKIRDTLGVDLQGNLEQALKSVDPSELFKVSDAVTKNAEANSNLEVATREATVAMNNLIAEYQRGAIVSVNVPAGSSVDSDNVDLSVRYN